MKDLGLFLLPWKVPQAPSFLSTSHLPSWAILHTWPFLGHSTHPSPQGVCELVEEIRQVLINYANGQHMVEGVQRDGRRGGKKDIGMALQKR